MAGGFSGWLRHNAEHYLLVDAQRKLSVKLGTAAPRLPKGAKEIFWLKIFAPVYSVLPWSLRHSIMRAMPGSHRKTWASPPPLQGPAV
ncbi:MAG: hypothetical protein EKK42_29045 [Pseudonocardiaceae bacterium]|nr:MAG: hypothetical protein EKK42_29045 [Pseudonocardiaceae bacterium]